MTQVDSINPAANPIHRIYEETFQQLLGLARETLNDSTFGTDVDELAAMTAIPGLSAQLEDELLHFARTVAKHRKNNN